MRRINLWQLLADLPENDAQWRSRGRAIFRSRYSVFAAPPKKPAWVCVGVIGRRSTNQRAADGELVNASATLSPNTVTARTRPPLARTSYPIYSAEALRENGFVSILLSAPACTGATAQATDHYDDVPAKPLVAPRPPTRIQTNRTNSVSGSRPTCS